MVVFAGVAAGGMMRDGKCFARVGIEGHAAIEADGVDCLDLGVGHSIAGQVLCHVGGIAADGREADEVVEERCGGCELLGEEV